MPPKAAEKAEKRAYAEEQKRKAAATAPAQPPDIADRLKRLNALKAEGLLSEEEYASQRAKIISAL